jgi:DNA modification methylase
MPIVPGPRKTSLDDFTFNNTNTGARKYARHFILHGDVHACLSSLKDESIDCAVTSPPYWGQRDYGFDGQVGNEPELIEYIGKLVEIFRVLRRKLKPEGVFYLNVGDKYLNKYGNSPLGMIPFKLAYYMVLDGWVLSDTIIWYKPNHMPSSVKNRFTNTYEPVFVLARSVNNYHSNHVSNAGTLHDNVLKVSLQQVPYKHMATYPEKLVENLIGFGLPARSMIVDTFAGSGTTARAVQNVNATIPRKFMSSIMIEASHEFVEIIKERCNIRNNRVRKVGYRDHDVPSLPASTEQDRAGITSLNIKDNFIRHGRIAIIFLKNPEEFENFIILASHGEIERTLDDDGILFVGLPDHDIKKIYRVSRLPGWIIRNVIVVVVTGEIERKDWIPVFMLVKDVTTVKYVFDLDAIRVDRIGNDDWSQVDFTGYKVKQARNYFKDERTGVIARILPVKNVNGMPRWVVVKWDSGDYSVEEVINPPVTGKKVEFRCPGCNDILDKFHDQGKKVSCPGCGVDLWQDEKSVPVLFLDERNPPSWMSREIEVDIKITKPEYDGKFKETDRINMGQSPGARQSVDERFFSVQRYYGVSQSMIADYLNVKRQEKGMSKKDITESFPPEYRHTCGHWFRKDRGGSIPKVHDLIALKDLLGLDDNYVNYMNRMGIKLQAVVASVNGKNPGDFLEMPVEKVVEMFKNLGKI